MTTMFNLRNIFQLVVDGLDQHPLAQEQLIVELDQARLHGALDRGQQLYSLLQQPRHQLFGEVPLLSHEFPKEARSPLGNRAAIIHIPGREAACQHLTLVVDHQVQLEAIEPIDRILPALGQPRSAAMVLDAAIVTDHQLG